MNCEIHRGSGKVETQRRCITEPCAWVPSSGILCPDPLFGDACVAIQSVLDLLVTSKNHNTHPFVHAFNNCPLSVHSLPATVLGTENSAANQTDPTLVTFWGLLSGEEAMETV